MSSPQLASQLAHQFGLANPGMAQRPEPAPYPTAAYQACNAERIVKAGGDLLGLLAHPSFVPFEHMFRKLPEEGVFTATPQRNFKFELGAFLVPRSMAFAMVDYRFDIYRPNGAAPGDFVPIEERRLSTQVGYDVTIDQYRKGNIRYQLEPTPIIAPNQARQAPAPTGGVVADGSSFGGVQPAQNTFARGGAPRGANASDYANAASAKATAPSGSGLATLPQRRERMGAQPLPFTMIVNENQRLSFEVVAFRPITVPVAFFEVTFSGLLMPANDLDTYMRAMKPCG